MQIVIFGATGSLGSHLVKQSLDMGYSVLAFTRNPEKLSHVHSRNLRVVKGDILSLSDVENAVRGKSAVLCAIGDGAAGRVRSVGTQNIVTAMSNCGVKRFICQTTLGLGESSGNLNFFWKYVMFGLLLKKAFKDHKLQEEYIFQSKLDFTVVRPSAFTNDEATRTYKIGFDGKYKKLNLKISRADIADFMLRQLTTNEFIRKPVSISN